MGSQKLKKMKKLIPRQEKVPALTNKRYFLIGWKARYPSIGKGRSGKKPLRGRVFHHRAEALNKREEPDRGKPAPWVGDARSGRG